MKIGLLAIPLLLAGCAAHVVSSNDRSVIVSAWEGDYKTAQALADAECKKSGRTARLAVKLSNTELSYDCIN